MKMHINKISTFTCIRVRLVLQLVNWEKRSLALKWILLRIKVINHQQALNLGLTAVE